MLRKLIKVFLFILLIGTGVFLALCKPVSQNESPFQEEDYYRQTLIYLDSITSDLPKQSGDTIQAGWSRQNITPDEPVKLMGYGFKGNYERVHDSLYVRVVMFSDGLQKIAFISYDLMIVHPDLKKAVQQALKAAFPQVDGLYFSAVHTHNGYGEWAGRLIGKITAGGYNEELVAMIVAQTEKAVRDAASDLAPVAIGYEEYTLPSLVANRLVKGEDTDDKLRVVKLHKATGENGVICTFSAHGTFVTSKSRDLSADYPGALVKRLEADTAINFALFAAGAVGSHSPVKDSNFSYQNLEQYAARIAAPVVKHVDKIPAAFSKKLAYLSLPVALGEPELKISRNWQVRPWMFHAFFGEIQPAITMLQVGDIIFAGYPADFSGLLYPAISVPAGLHLVITSFNGGYIGYIIPDIFYDKKHREARELNWFGSHTGSYFVALTDLLLERMAEHQNKKSGQ